MTKPIKIMHVLALEKQSHYFNNLVDLSDDSRFVYSFANFAGPNEFSDSMRSRGHQVFDVGRLSKLRLPLAFSRFWRWLRATDPDIVHTHLFDPTFVGLLAAKLQGRATVLTRHHSDAVHAIDSGPKRRFYLALERQNNRRADHIIALSKVVRGFLVDREGVTPEKVTIIPNPQTMVRYEKVTGAVIAAKRVELGMNGQLSLVCVSRLYPRKGHAYLFEALAPMLRTGLRAKLYLVGAGEHQAVLERQADEWGITPNVEFLGWRDDALEIVAAADVIVHPSLEDALSQALIESLMLSKPIIATDISGARDILDDGKYGTLVKPADADALRTALSDTIDDLQSARERARNGREYLLDYMDAGRVAAAYCAIYQKVTGADDGS